MLIQKCCPLPSFYIWMGKKLFSKWVWYQSTPGKIIPNFLARNRPSFSESHRDICKANTVLNIQTFENSLQSCGDQLPLLVTCISEKCHICICWCTVNCFQGISLLQVEANYSKLFLGSWLDIATVNFLNYLLPQRYHFWKKQCPYHTCSVY